MKDLLTHTGFNQEEKSNMRVSGGDSHTDIGTGPLDADEAEDSREATLLSDCENELSGWDVVPHRASNCGRTVRASSAMGVCQ